VLAVFALFTKLELIRGEIAFPVLDGMGAFAIACVALFTAKLVLDRTVFRACSERPVGVATVALVGLALGILTILPFVGALLIVGVDLSRPTIPGLLLGGALRCVVLFPVVTYLVGLRQWYVTTRRTAEQELVRAETARMEAGDDVDATRALIIETARREISPSQREASDLLKAAVRSESPGDLTRAAESLRSTARTAVRSTSHDLWVDDGTSATIRWRSIVPGALGRYPLPLLLPVLIILGSTIVRSNRVIDPRVLLLAVVTVVAVPCLLYLAGRAVIARAPRSAIGVTAVAIVAAPVASQVGASAILDRPLVLVTIAGVTLVAATFTVASSVVLMVRDSGAAVIQSLVDDRARADAQQAALNMMNKRLSRELATHLHGTVQPQLLAASVALDGAVESDDPSAIADAVAQAEAALGMEVRPPEEQGLPALDDLVAGLTARWHAMLELDVTANALPGAPAPPGGVTRALDECLNNAVIHGCATRATVSISHVHDGWRIEVADNGVGPAAGAPGLGSSVLDELTGGDWSLDAGPAGGAVLRAHVRDRSATPAG
jgi:signal transduction histidine kinase